MLVQARHLSVCDKWGSHLEGGVNKELLLREAVQLSDKLRLFNSKFYHEFDGVNIFCQKLTLLREGHSKKDPPKSWGSICDQTVSLRKKGRK